MLSILFPLILSIAEADVPKISLGPEAIHQAKELKSPIDQVTVYSDRAEVHRTSSSHFKAGIHTIKLSNLPNTISLDSLRVSSKQAKIIRIQPQYVESQEYSLEELQKIIDEMEQLQNEIHLLQTQKNILNQELQNLRNVHPTNPVQESQRKSPASYNSQSWLTTLNFLSSRQADTNKKIEAINAEYEKKYERWKTLNEKSQPFLQGSYNKQSVELIVVLQVPKERKVNLDVNYFINGAYWFPTYDVHYDSKTDQVRIESAAYVQQYTGEDWTDAKIALSTSMPNLNLEMPDLLTWTLGEKNEYIPHPRAARYSNPPPSLPPPVLQQTLHEVEKSTKREAYYEQQNYLVQLNNQVQNGITQNLSNNYTNTAYGIGSASYGAAGSSAVGGLGTRGSGYGGGGRAYKAQVSSGYVQNPSDDYAPPMEAAYDYAEAEEVYFDDIEISGELMKADSASVRAAPRRSRPQKKGKSVVKTSSSLQGYSEGGEAYSNVNLAIEAPNYYRTDYYPNPNLPCALAKGMDYRWDAIGTFTIPANNTHVRIPLYAKTHKATSFYETTPALEEMAYLKANLKNTEEQAILQGSASIFLNKRYTSQSQLRTTEKGGSLDLPLGADENIRVKRNITPQQRKEGILNQNETTDYSVKIEVGNYKDNPIQIRVFDLIPKTNNNDIDIEYLESSHKFKSEPDANGVLYWDLVIPAGKTETVTLKYSITRPKNWKLWGN